MELWGFVLWGGMGITLMKNKFQKASITSAHAWAPAFAFQCEVQPPLFMTLYTSKPWPASLSLTHSISLSPLIPIVTSSPGSPETVCVYGGAGEIRARGTAQYQQAADGPQCTGVQHQPKQAPDPLSMSLWWKFIFKHLWKLFWADSRMTFRLQRHKTVYNFHLVFNFGAVQAIRPTSTQPANVFWVMWS